ncbi:MAG: YbjQ family protein [Chloroflexi bacterium]|nr:YbjQ family protein [Chloroflexota bacterium]
MLPIPAHEEKLNSLRRAHVVAPEIDLNFVNLRQLEVVLRFTFPDGQKYETRCALIISTIQDVPGRDITEILGLARGNSVRARHAGKDILAALRNIVGGEIAEYARLQAETREMATRRMAEFAETLGADAIVGVRYTTSMIATGASEILAYGTAVKLS